MKEYIKPEIKIIYLEAEYGYMLADSKSKKEMDFSETEVDDIDD